MTQNSREALIDLLFLSLYLDAHLSLAEDELLTAAVNSLGWEGTASREAHIFKAFTNARKLSADPGKAEEFLVARADVIKADGQEKEALSWLTRVLASDGLTNSEQRFLAKLESRLFPGAS